MAKSPKAAIAEAMAKSGGTASKWISEIDLALKREERFRDRARKVVQRYRDERLNDTRGSAATSASRVNILWSNTEILKSALYARTPKPDVRRRFPDVSPRGKNDISRVTAEVMERSLIYCTDAYDVDTPIERAVEDMLLPGRGTVWVVYEPEIEGDEGLAQDTAEGGGEDHDEAPNGAGAQTGQGEYGSTDAAALSPAGPRIVSQKLCLEHVYWEDFCHGLAREWSLVPWVGRRHAMPVEKFDEKFPEAAKLKGRQADYELVDASERTSNAGEGSKFVEIWEIWDKPSRTRVYIARGYKDVLGEDDDPYQLNDFFPCPRPLYSVTTTDRMTPEPEFLQYQDQANELDVVTTRIMKLTDHLRWNGIYDSSVPDSNVLKDMASAGDGEFLPHAAFQQIREKGGIDAAFGFRPIERIEPVIASLDERRRSLVEIIYQVTGISDIVRGATDPRETKGAQQLKAQFGSIRMQARQKDVQRFIRDTYRIMAEIIAEHFTAEHLVAMTGIELPTEEERMAAKMELAVPVSPPGMQAPAGGGFEGAPVSTPAPAQTSQPPAGPMPGMQSGPPMQGARQAPDGHWYVTDPRPNRQGKYMRVNQQAA